jgi:MSHA biogenesis protein MshQ
VDTDSVSTATGATESAATALIRSGRLHLLNAYGSELLAIKVPVQAEYYNGTNWMINTSDTCTTITAGSVTASNGIATNTCFLTNPRPSAPTNASCQASSPAMTTAAGVGSWYVFDKTTPQVGYTDLTINLSATPWLLGRWSGSGTSYTENPIARIKFGSPKAPYIYLRERY